MINLHPTETIIIIESTFLQNTLQQFPYIFVVWALIEEHISDVFE